MGNISTKMKAIRKSDGKIIDVEVHGWNGDRPISYHTNFKDFYKPEDLDFNIPQETEQSSSFDWQSFRAEAAKDILCATLSGGIASGMIDMIAIIQEKESIVNGSIEIADELIKALKEKEEE